MIPFHEHHNIIYRKTKEGTSMKKIYSVLLTTIFLISNSAFANSASCDVSETLKILKNEMQATYKQVIISEGPIKLIDKEIIQIVKTKNLEYGNVLSWKIGIDRFGEVCDGYFTINK